ncbi:MAG: hypothetical protein ABJA69_12710 [Acidobacteriaceae bacterium]
MANKLWATVRARELSQEPNALRFATTLVPAAGFGSAILLKTNLRYPARNAGSTPDALCPV